MSKYVKRKHLQTELRSKLINKKVGVKGLLPDPNRLIVAFEAIKLFEERFGVTPTYSELTTICTGQTRYSSLHDYLHYLEAMGRIALDGICPRPNVHHASDRNIVILDRTPLDTTSDWFRTFCIHYIKPAPLKKRSYHKSATKRCIKLLDSLKTQDNCTE